MSFDDKWNGDDEPEALLFPNRRGLLKVLGVAGAGSLAGCSTSGGQNTTTAADTTEGMADTTTTGSETTTQEELPEPSGTYMSAQTTGATTLNWISVADANTNDRIGLTLDSAYAITSEQEIFPLWADISSDDGRVYEVTLRENLQWGADYGQMTAEDWVYMIKNVFQTEDNWAGYTSPGDWKRQDEFIPVEKTGKYSFEIQLPEVDPAYPKKPIMWGQYAMPKGLLEKYVPDKDAEGLQQDEEIQQLQYAGNLGPFSFEEWDRESEFVATRNDDYYLAEADDVPERFKGAPYFNERGIKVIPEQSTRLAALREGEITETGIPSTKAKDFQENVDNVNVNVAPQSFENMMVFNMRQNGWHPFRKKKVRQAFAMSINTRTIAENIRRGFANPAVTHQPRFSQFYDDSQVTVFGYGDGYDPQQARSMLEDALSDTDYGYDGDQLVGPDGDQLELKHVYSTGDQVGKTIMEFVNQEIGKLGIATTSKGFQFNTMLQRAAYNTYQGEGEPEFNPNGPFNGGPRDKTASKEQWDIMTGIGFNSYPLTPSSTRVFWESKKTSINFYGYYPEPDFQSLYNEASQEPDVEKRKEIYGEIFGLLSEEQPVNFLTYSTGITGYDAEVVGPKEKYLQEWDQQSWYFSQG